MSVFVVVALALAVMTAGVAVIAVLQVRSAATGLASAVSRAADALRPLAAELGEEVAVTGREVEALAAQKGAGRTGPARVH